eukprot:CAMPEP_0195145590 /NCGR_PEP_ID=MMETSP0448-20130528/170090_1 /TAXON_ID=66468 /ORGANISM="Heterocapsa triquestra, Strain CCMP 448" /LENGTH=63 /DNA_ID=CAMNT_0040184105 /DNA_START=143 /DNA_END=330 /DNA_ORIENTATION=+
MSPNEPQPMMAQSHAICGWQGMGKGLPVPGQPADPVLLERDRMPGLLACAKEVMKESRLGCST